MLSLLNCSHCTSCHISWVVLELGVFIHFVRLAAASYIENRESHINVDHLPQAHKCNINMEWYEQNLSVAEMPYIAIGETVVIVSNSPVLTALQHEPLHTTSWYDSDAEKH